MPKPHNVARPCLLLRVSTDEQDMTQQEREAREYCLRTYGVDLPESAIFREHGISGSKNTFEQRTELKRAVEACERGDFTHFIVHKLDRSARSVRVFTEVWDRLTRTHVAFVAIVEGIDSSRGDTALTAQVLSAVAEFFSRNLSREIKKGKRGRIYKGMTNGKPPFGYYTTGSVYLPDLREIEDHPGVTRVDIVRRIFQEVAEGWSVAEIVTKLNRQGILMESVKYGTGLFRRNSVRSMLDNRFYIGEVPDIPGENGEQRWRTGAHEAIIDVDLFNCAQAQLAEHALHPRTVRRNTNHWIFSGGILRCAECRDRGITRSVSFHPYNHYPTRNTTYLSCTNRYLSRFCQAPNVREDLIAIELGNYLEHWQADPDLIDQAVARYRLQCEIPDQNTIALERRKKIQAQLTRLGDRYELGDIDREEYLRRRAGLRDQLLAIVVNEPQHMSEEVLMQITATMRHIKTAWDLANNKQKAEMVRMLFRAIWIRDRHIESVEPQPHFRMFFGGDIL